MLNVSYDVRGILCTKDLVMGWTLCPASEPSNMLLLSDVSDEVVEYVSVHATMGYLPDDLKDCVREELRKRKAAKLQPEPKPKFWPKPKLSKLPTHYQEAMTAATSRMELLASMQLQDDGSLYLSYCTVKFDGAQYVLVSTNCISDNRPDEYFDTFPPVIDRILARWW